MNCIATAAPAKPIVIAGFSNQQSHNSFMADADRAEFLLNRDGQHTLLNKLAELKLIYRRAAFALKTRDEWQSNVDRGDGTSHTRIVRPQKNNPYRKAYVQAAANHRILERFYRAVL